MATRKERPEDVADSIEGEKKREAEKKDSKPKAPLKTRVTRFTFLLLILACAGMYGWKWWSERSLREDFEKQLKSQQTILAERSLLLMGAASQWAHLAVGSNNTTVINARIKDLIRLDEVEKVLVAGPSGTITYASDQKLTGEPMLNASVGAVTVSRQDEMVILTVPLENDGLRVGTLQYWLSAK